MIAACYVLHYGREWLYHSMRSVNEFVDDIFVFYSATPSHGQSTDLKCPETRDELKSIADKFGARWVDCGPFGWEGAHRDYALSVMQQAGHEQALIVDADEVWCDILLSNFIDVAKTAHERNIRVGMRHFWRSCKWVCDDGTAPVRMINFKYDDGEAYYPLDGGKVWHFGYAQSPAIIKYKIDIHGHKNEWRQDWFDNKFMAWYPGCGMTDVHPTCVNFWNPAPYYLWATHLRDALGDHAYFDKGIIE